MADDAGWIVVSGLTKVFGAVRAVDDLSFTGAPLEDIFLALTGGGAAR